MEVELTYVRLVSLIESWEGLWGRREPAGRYQKFIFHVTFILFCIIVIK